MKIAVIGDIHTAYTHEVDGPALSRGLYDAVLVVGDLAGLRFGPCLQVASDLAALAAEQTVLVQPGNHDTASPVQLLAEVVGVPWLSVLSTRAQLHRYDAFLRALGAAQCMAYRAHVLDGLTVIGGRPFSMGGPRLAFQGILARRFGVRTLADSTDRMCALIDESSGPVLFLAHNGPTGLGDTRRDIWGRDFHPAEGDWGDVDLRRAITYAQQSGRTVLAVVAGHMHHYIRGGRRTWHVQRDGVHYVNAAAVPRVTRDGRHHVALTIEEASVEVEARWVR